MTLLTLLRHGETDWNLQRRIQGSSDIPLNETGRAQARAAGLRLAEESPADLPIVMAASSLSRAQETAQIIADVLEVDPPVIVPDLRERAYGEAEGLNDEEFLARWGDWGSADVPGAEPWDAVRERAVRGMRALVALARQRSGPAGCHVVAVSHGATIRAVLRHATGDPHAAAGIRLANGSAHTFLVERERLRLLSSPALASD